MPLDTKMRINKAIGSLSKIALMLDDGLILADAINTETDRIAAAENLITGERNGLHGALESLCQGSWWDARARREP